MLLLVAVAGYAIVAAVVWLLQDRLVFYPRAAAVPATPPSGWRLEDLEIAARDGTKLAGVLVRPPRGRPPVVIYFGGNAEEVTARAAAAKDDYGDRAVVLMNYRGYGRSAGRPSEKSLVADALEIFDAIKARSDLDTSRVAVHGRSLGSGVAVQVAAARAAACVLLTTPFDSARAVAAAIYPWLPVGLLLRHPFDSAAHAPSLRMPALILVGERDTLIPPKHARRLAGLWAGPVDVVALPAGHDDISDAPGYGRAIHDFLERCQPGAVRESLP